MSTLKPLNFLARTLLLAKVAMSALNWGTSYSKFSLTYSHPTAPSLVFPKAELKMSDYRNAKKLWRIYHSLTMMFSSVLDTEGMCVQWSMLFQEYSRKETVDEKHADKIEECEYECARRPNFNTRYRKRQ